MNHWTAAYESYRPALLGFLARRLRNREEAEDLCQETFARVMRAPAAPREGPQLGAYLFRTASHLACSLARRGRRVLAENELPEALDLGSLPDPTAESPAARVEWRDLAEQVSRLLETLPPGQRAAFERGALQCRPYAEVAEELGCSAAKVKIDVFRARRALIAGLASSVEGR